MDLIQATEDRLVRKVGQQDCTFHFLCAYDRAELLKADLANRQAKWRQRRERLLENLKTAGITGEQMFAELERFEDQTPEDATLDDWIVFVNNPVNEVAIFAASLKPTHAAEAEQLAKQAIISFADKAKICGLIVTGKSDGGDKKKPEGESDPNQIPATYGT